MRSRKYLININIYFFISAFIISNFIISCGRLNQGRSFKLPPPPAPQIDALTPVVASNVEWSWLSTDNSADQGTGIFQYSLNNSEWSSDTLALSYSPSTALATGFHTLRVKERGSSGDWSDPSSFIIEVVDKIHDIYVYKNSAVKSFSFTDTDTNAVTITQAPSAASGTLDNEAHDGTTVSFDFTATAGFEGATQARLQIDNGGAISKVVVIRITLLDQTTNNPSDDTYIGSLWGLQTIEADYAWNYKTDCRNLLIGVIDTGINTRHEDLKDNIHYDLGKDFVNNDNNPFDDNGHGTHVAGTIAAVGNNETGVVGICWKAKLVALKTLNASGVGTYSDMAEAISYAAANNIRVTNNSYGGTSADTDNFLGDAIDEARAAGHIFVAAAGNSAADLDTTIGLPADFAETKDNVISVASIDASLELSSFSNYGSTTVNIAAPGAAIYSTILSGYDNSSGTSMACPHVAGAVAFLWSFDTSIAYTDIINYIRDNSDAAADGLDDKLIWTTGIYQNARGQLNIFKAVEALLKDKGYLDEP